MPKKELFNPIKHEFCFYVLSRFDFTPGEIRIDDLQTIQNGCKKVLHLIGLDDEWIDQMRSRSSQNEEDNLDLFMYYFLEFDSLPGVHRQRLRELNKIDLNDINKKIADYERDPFIKSGDRPRNQNQRTTSDFYNRCLNERVQIKKHFKNGIDERAIQKANISDNYGGVRAIMDFWYDRPYRLSRPKAREYFDETAIDKVSHRILELSLSKGRRLAQLYTTNKKKFYNELNIYIPIDNELKQLISNVDWLPFIIEQRKQIFREVVELFKSKNYFGTYALALTQVEGLFTDMCRICIPGFNDYKASLPDKVEIVRKFHDSEGRMDYFQYHLPNLRNRFLHYGTDSNENIEDLCHDIVYDLIEVVSIFYQLNIDANKFLRMVRKRDDADFMHIEGFSNYLRLFKKLKHNKQLIHFETEINLLNQTYLPGVLYNLSFDLEDTIKKVISSIKPGLKAVSKLDGLEIDIEATPIANVVKNPFKPAGKIDRLFRNRFKTEVLLLLQINCMLADYKRIMDQKYIEEETLNFLDKIQNRYTLVFRKINLICKQLNFDPQTDF